MKKLFVAVFFSLLSFAVAASVGNAPAMDHIEPDINDKASLQRGLALYSDYCFGCHSLKYARYERTADDLGIPHDVFMEELVFGDAKIGQLMNISMPSDQAKVWFGNPPPDLTLSARLRGPDWLYNYLRGFYADAKKPYGVNNVIFKDVGMPHVLAGLQGVCAKPPVFGVEKAEAPQAGNAGASACAEYSIEGTLSPREYDEAIYDLVNFLEYIGEPSRAESLDLGRMVLIFLAFLFVFVYFLNKEYWRGIH